MKATNIDVTLMVTLQKLTQYTNTFLQIDCFNDYCPNGLQVEGSDSIQRIVTGVTASQALLEDACDKNADAVLVHHGYFWKNEDPRVIGMKRARLNTLLVNNISLLAYHLPLDAHPEVGNNVQLAQFLGIQVEDELSTNSQPACGSVGYFKKAMDAVEVKQLIESKLNHSCIHVDVGSTPITTVAWCTGAGQGFIDIAAGKKLDAYISGEISEQTTHIAREAGIHYFAAGHHATERYGIQALGEHLAGEFDLVHSFVDIDNPA